MKTLFISLLLVMVAGCDEKYNTHIIQDYYESGHLFTKEIGRYDGGMPYEKYQHSGRCPNPIHKDTCKCN